MNLITDTRILKIRNIINEYTTTLNSIYDTFFINYDILSDKKKKAKSSVKDFLKKYKIQNDNDLHRNIKQHPENAKIVKSLLREDQRSEMAYRVMPQSFFVSIISQFDVLVGQLIRFIFGINPNKLFESDATITLRDLFKINDIEKVKERLVNDKIDTILRKSHTDQVYELSKLVDNTPLHKVDFWCDFIEMTQRRNLFVHNKGVVSEQYLLECKKGNCNINCNIGDTLYIDDLYFKNTYFVFYCMGTLLSQVIVRKILSNSNLSEIDNVLNNIIYESICEGKYDIAIELSKFALEKSTKHANRLDEVYFVLNYAQSFKWNGDSKKCGEILKEYDFSAMTPDILVAKYALESDIEKVACTMKQIGDTSNIMTKESYVTWEIFKEMREKKEFKAAYYEVFNESFPDDGCFDIEDLSID